MDTTLAVLTLAVVRMLIPGSVLMGLGWLINRQYTDGR
jgi:hypothetical protein